MVACAGDLKSIFYKKKVVYYLSLCSNITVFLFGINKKVTIIFLNLEFFKFVLNKL